VALPTAIHGQQERGAGFPTTFNSTPHCIGSPSLVVATEQK